jgi:hypothetical protein
MRWVTRERPKTDRIACPWLIRGFIDPDAEILYVRADEVLEVASREGARSFDAPGAEFTHRDGMCSFEVLIQDFELASDPALVRLAHIVHAADVAEDRDSDPLGAGLEAIGAGGGARGAGRSGVAPEGHLRLRRALRMVPGEPHANAG